ncbi:MAG: hypothetical protein J1F02_05150 [Lachnospiraceae bacterium]|nr:hypothetical protein [Lachnospiraceae bacterium]
MITTIKGKKITGILTVMPENEYDYDEETKPFATLQTKRLKRIMGFGKRRAAKADSTASDYCVYGLNYLLNKGYIKKEEIGAIVVTGLTPDYFIPHVSNIIHGECNLPQDVICIDIPQGCAGFMLGALQAFLLLDVVGDKKVLVFNSDVLNRKDKKTPLTSASFGGDATAITIFERDDKASDIYINFYNDGTEREALIMHAGGYKMPRSPQTAVPVDIGDGTMKSYDDLWMDGSKVFNFVQKEVPPLINEILEYASMKKEDIDWFIFHQPNKFMLQKLSDKLGISWEKIPMNVVENFGNTSGSTIPVAITHNFSGQMVKSKYKCCLAGFGAGLSWSSMILDLGCLDFCEMIISNY